MTYVLSDIHGRIKPWHQMLKLINFSENDILYVLGDVIDRNPSGIRILKEIISMPNVHMIRGNHEHMMLETITVDPDENWDRWADRYDLWCEWNGGLVTYKAFYRESKKSQKAILDYLENLPINVELDINGKQILLVHAAPMSMFKQPEPEMETPEAFAVWYRIYPWDEVEIPYDLMICGHTPTVHFSQKNPQEVFQKGKIMWIDCGCSYGKKRGGRLACVCLETGEVFYEDA